MASTCTHVQTHTHECLPLPTNTHTKESTTVGSTDSMLRVEKMVKQMPCARSREEPMHAKWWTTENSKRWGQGRDGRANQQRALWAMGGAELEGFLQGISWLRPPSGDGSAVLMESKAICAFASGSGFTVLLEELCYFLPNGNLIHIQMNAHFHFFQDVEFCPHIEFCEITYSKDRLCAISSVVLDCRKLLGLRN